MDDPNVTADKLPEAPTVVNAPAAARIFRLVAPGIDHYVATGSVSGARYDFYHDTDTAVQEGDAPALLELTMMAGGCCGPGSVGAGPRKVLKES